MKGQGLVAFCVAWAIGCGGGAEPATDRTKPAAPEPDRVTVAHILVSFAGVPKVNALRSKADAEKLANDLLRRAARGEDFDKLMKDFSDDPGLGVYTMVNRGSKKSSEDDVLRDRMVPAVGDVGFKLDVGGLGMASYDPVKSPDGWHVIRRLK